MKTDTKDSAIFSELLSPYCSEEEKEQFLSHLDDTPVSSFILNTYHNYTPSFPSIRKDEEDSLLYLFDKDDVALGKSADHFSGAFYILDPSSATISYYLKDYLKKDFNCLDLCGAPGGKTISLAMRRKDGFYLCNDISYQRANEIRKNVERLGLTNVLSLSIDPINISSDLLFDCIILDVPCSGSGMIRKEEKMKEDWSTDKVERLLPIQKNLLEKGYQLLKKDGILAYSTCSLSIEEDEIQVKEFLSRHNDMEQIMISPKKGMKVGKDNLGYHMIPGLFEGEGIYFCLLKKKDGHLSSFTALNKTGRYKETDKIIFDYRKNSYVVDKMYKEISSLPYIAPGIKIKDDSPHPKCEFDHAYSKIAADINHIDIDEKSAIEYIKGNEIKTDQNGKDGLCVVTYKSIPLGFGKKVKDKIKNYLPKGLRESILPLETKGDE